jgi:V-type H+-transporting ATPase subunit a
MFGDIAHGGALFLFSLYMVKNYQQLKREKSVLEPVLPLRFLLALMGFFAVFAGFIYNDFASKNYYQRYSI